MLFNNKEGHSNCLQNPCGAWRITDKEELGAISPTILKVPKRSNE